MGDTLTEAGVGGPDKVYVCPGCGAEYAEPTTCTNQHPPIDTVEYDKATIDEAKAAAGTGTVASDVAPADPVADPAPNDTAADPAPADSAPDPAPVASGLEEAFGNVQAAVDELKTALGL